MMKTGDHVVCSDNVYGGTGRLFDQVLTNYGLTFTYVDTSVAENVAAAITPATKLVHIETPTNPMMSITDIAAVAEICHAKGVELSVDNTFLSPYLQQPIALGSRNQYDAGLQQALGKWVTLDVSYFRKYTRNAYDFDALFSTPITFPIGWRQSKLDGVSARAVAPFAGREVGVDVRLLEQVETHARAGASGALVS